MRRRLGLTLAFLLGLVLATSLYKPVAAQNTQNFDVVSFNANYDLSRDQNKTSNLKVEETIVAEFPSFNQNHGILRAIPKSYQDHTVSLDVLSVTDAAGLPYNFSTSDENDNQVLKVGNANKYVHGLTTYKINYTLKNVTSFLDDHEELYWDINGDQWQQPFGSVTAQIHIAKDVADNLQDRLQCYGGAYGQTIERCTITRVVNDDGSVTVNAAAQNLRSGETLTIVLGFNKDTFVLGPEIQAEKDQKRQRIIKSVATLLLTPILVSGWLWSKWRKYGRDPAGRGVIIPEYQPPKDLNALSSDVILHETLRNQAISALIVELAIKGYISISEIAKKSVFGKKDYELELLKDPADLGDYEQRVLKMFFEGSSVGDRVMLTDLKNKLYSETKKLGEDLGKSLFEAGYFRSDPAKARRKYLILGVVVLFGSFFLIGITPFFGIGLVISGLIIMICSSTMPARSASGVEARDYLLGLRDYMKLAEADRIKFLQSPEGAEKVTSSFDPQKPKEKIKLFEKLLPYAMLFGIEKDWAKQFQDLYKQPPDWYHGNWSTFNAGYLASSLGDFNSTNAASFSAPSSSGSSGFGGGFSGGGGGGGGGGGW